MNKIAEMDPEILYALELEHAFWGNEAEREQYFVAQKQLLDEISNERTHEVLLKQKTAEAKAEGEALGEARGKAKGKAEGEALGEARGKVEGKVEVAKNLLAMNLDIDAVAKATGLSAEELLRLRT